MSQPSYDHEHLHIPIAAHRHRPSGITHMQYHDIPLQMIKWPRRFSQPSLSASSDDIPEQIVAIALTGQLILSYNETRRFVIKLPISTRIFCISG
jgi:hypothetical protein